MKIPSKAAVGCIALLAVAGCGGGGSDSDSDPAASATARISPIVSTIDERQNITLDGSASSSKSGDIQNYEWTISAPDSITWSIENPTASSTLLNIGEAAASGDIKIQLAVKGPDASHGTASVVVQVNEIDEQALPPKPDEGGIATLHGVDSDNDGLRDDVEHSIYQLHKHESLETRAVLKFGARQLQNTIDAGSGEAPFNAKEVAEGVAKTVACIHAHTSYTPAERRTALSKLKLYVVNTEQRAAAYLYFKDALDGSVTSLVEVTEDDCLKYKDK